jgi:hypothetical protein
MELLLDAIFHSPECGKQKSVCNFRNKYLLYSPRSDCQSFWMKRAEYQEPPCAVCEDGQVLLHQHKCGHSGFIDVCSTQLVVYAQYVRVSRTVRITIYSTVLSISSLNSNAASKMWSCSYLHLTCMRQALCCTC